MVSGPANVAGIAGAEKIRDKILKLPTSFWVLCGGQGETGRKLEKWVDTRGTVRRSGGIVPGCERNWLAEGTGEFVTKFIRTTC